MSSATKQGYGLLKDFGSLPEPEQNKILVDAFGQIATLHDAGKSFDSFSWRGCVLDNASLTINCPIDDYFNEEALQRNLLDYAGVIYCLTTGKKSAESMSWDAGRKIQSNVLRGIVLAICGRNDSVKPLLAKLRQPYDDEDTFFENYTTVDEKEGHEGAEKQRIIDEQNRANEESMNNGFPQSSQFASASRKTRGEKIVIFILMVLSVLGYRVCKYEKQIKRQQAAQQIEQMHQQRRERQEELRKQNYKLDLKNNRVVITQKDSENADASKQELE